MPTVTVTPQTGVKIGHDTLLPSHSFAQPAITVDTASGDRNVIARNVLAAIAPQAGLTAADAASVTVTDSYTSQGQSHVYFFQELNGLPILNATAGVHLTADMQPLVVNTAFVPNLAAVAPAFGPAVVSATEAVSLGAAAFGYAATAPTLILATGGVRQAAVYSDPAFSDLNITVERAYVNTARGVRPVWEMSARTPDGDHWYHLTVDTQDGAVEYYADWVDNFDSPNETYNIVPQPNESPLDGGFATLVNPSDPVASPYGWHDTNGIPGAEYTTTRGNNVDARDDLDDNDDTTGYQPNAGPTLVFNYPFNDTLDPQTNLPTAVTNLFYFTNIMHDVMYKYGFDEAAGNFQEKNYTGAAGGGDAVQADAQDGSGFSNANFSTPPDGSQPRMQMYRYTQSNPDRDGDLDNGIMAHEYGHGVSNRLTGGASNSSALNSQQSGGMGEGWSDFFGLMLTQKPTDVYNGKFSHAAYASGQTANGDGNRQHPYSYDMTIDPMTFADYGTGAGQDTEVHWAGALWASALWDMNWLFINKYGYDPDLNTGYAPPSGVAGDGPAGAGNKLALKLVLDAMKLQPTNPSFIQARNAILTADIALTGGLNQREIWEAFARRGLGSGSDTQDADSDTVTTSFVRPLASSTPAVTRQVANGATSTAPASLTLKFSEVMNTTSFDPASDVVSFTGPNGVDLSQAITGFAWSTETDPYTGLQISSLQINFTPQTAQGQYKMVLAPTILAADNNALLNQDYDITPGESLQDRYTAFFQYDAAAQQVTAFTPAAGVVVPTTTTSIDVTFSEPVLATSLTPDDLELSQGTPTAVTLDATGKIATFTVSGFTGIGEPTIFASLKYGAVTDAAGFASLSYNTSFALDAGTLVYPPLIASGAFGSLVYDTTYGLPAAIGTVGDVDTFTVNLEANQRLSATVVPTAGSGLIPSLTIFDSSGSNGTSASTAGQAVTITRAVITAGTYTVRVSGASGSTGGYTLRVMLNASAETETFTGSTNDAANTAQSLDPLLTTPGAGVSVASVVGIAGRTPFETESNATFALANDETNTFVPQTGSNVYQLGFSGTIINTANGVDSDDYYNLGTFQPGDIVTISVSATDSGVTTGVLNPTLKFYQLNGTQVIATTPTSDNGPGRDALIYRYRIVNPGTYLIDVSGTIDLTPPTAPGFGNYIVGVRLENAGLAPNSGGVFTGEVAPTPVTPPPPPNTVPQFVADTNGSIATALDASTSWKQVTNRAVVTGNIGATTDQDFFKYTFTANDRVTIRVVGDNGLLPSVALLDSTGTVILSSNGSSLPPAEAGLYSFIIPTTGTYYVRVGMYIGSGVTAPGPYTLDLLQSGTTPGQLPESYDWYSVSSVADKQSISAGISGSAGTSVQIYKGNFTAGVLTSTTLVATGTAATGYATTVDYQVPTGGAGTYFIRVGDTATVPYQLTVSRGAILDRGVNTTVSTGQFLPLGSRALGGITTPSVVFVGPGSVTVDDVAFYEVNIVTGGVPIRFRTLTPGDAAGDFVNTLDPILDVYDPSGNVVATNDNAANGDGRNAFVTIANPITGAYKVRVRGANGTTGEYIVTADQAPNSGPTGVTAGGPYPVAENGTVTLAAAATDPDGDPLTYAWDLDDDGQYDDATGPNPTLTPAQRNALGINDGDATGFAYPIRVQVTDGIAPPVTSADTAIIVSNSAPTGTASNTGPVPEGSTTATVNVTGATDASAEDVAAGLHYAYDFNNNGMFDAGDIGDGTYAGSVSTASATVPASLLADGASTKTVRILVIDQDGGTTTLTTTLTVTGVAPTATLSNGGAVTEGGTGMVTVGTVTDPSGPDVTAGFKYAYDFDNNGTYEVGDGTYAGSVTANTQTVPATYFTDGPGSLTVRVRIIDKDGDASNATTTIAITNANPTATLTGGTGVEGGTSTVTFSSPNDAAPADVAAGFKYAFDFDNNGTFEVGGSTYATSVTTPTATVPASFVTDSGTPTVHGRIYDKDGGFTDYTATLTIANVNPAATFAGGTAVEGTTGTVAFSGPTDASSADTAAGFRYAYDFDNNGTFEVGGTTYATSVTTATATVPAQYLAAGPSVRTVHGRIYDKDDGSTDYTATITVTNANPTATLTVGPATEGSAILVTVSAQDVADDQPTLRYSYDFDGNGTFDLGGNSYATAEPDNTTFLPASDSGQQTVKVRVFDKDGGFVDATATFAITNVAPTGQFVTSGTVNEGGSATVTFQNVTDPSNLDTAAGFKYSFDFDNDGTFDIANVDTASVPVPAGFVADGGKTQTIRGRVTDKDGGSTDYTADLVVVNVAPTASFASDGAVLEGATGSVTFAGASDASAADRNAGLRYAFDFDNDGTFDLGDGTYAGSVSAATAAVPPAFLPDGPANPTVRGRVIDKDGGATDYTTTVEVRNAAPTGSLVVQSGAVGQPTTASFANLADVPADLSAGLRFEYDFVENGQTTTVPAGPGAVTYTFANPGTYTVRGRVIDKDGGVTEYTTTTAVGAIAPTATLTGSSTVEGGSAAVTFSNPSHPAARSNAAGFRYAYDFDNNGTFDLGDGTFAGSVTDTTAAVPAGLLRNSGTITVLGRVLEVDGGFTDYTTTVTIANVPPTGILIVPNRAINAGSAFTVSIGSAADPSPLDAANLRYSFDTNGDGVFDVVNSPSNTASVTFDTPGTYTVRGRVTDPDGAFTDSSATVAVLEAGAAPLPPITPPKQPAGYAVATDAGEAQRVILFGASGQVLFDGAPFDLAFTGGVRVAAADVDGDGVTDLIAGTGPGVPTLVRVISGATRNELFSVQPFETSFTGGVFVAAGDVDGDGKAELAISPDEGGGPRVRVFRGGAFTVLTDYFGIDDPNFRGGARPAFGDVSGDGRADLLVAAGFGGGPRVSVWDGAFLGTRFQRTLFGDFFLFEQTLRNGVFITSGDLDGDGYAEVITGGGPGGGPRVFALNGQALLSGQFVPEANFFAGDPNARGGVRVAAHDFDGDNRADLITASGPGSSSRVTRYLAPAIPNSGQPAAASDDDFFPGLNGGVFVG